MQEHADSNQLDTDFYRKFKDLIVYPGVTVGQLRRDGSHQLDINKAQWEESEDIMAGRTEHFLHDMERFIHPENWDFVVEVCCDSKLGATLLDSVTALKLYRFVPGTKLRRTQDVMLRARRIFECWQEFVHYRGMSMMRRELGWRVIRRILLFSRVACIFEKAGWLFGKIQVLHDDVCEEESQGCFVHAIFAEFLEGVIAHLRKFDHELMPAHQGPLQNLRGYFQEKSCGLCFHSGMQEMLEHLLGRCTILRASFGSGERTGILQTPTAITREQSQGPEERQDIDVYRPPFARERHSDPQHEVTVGTVIQQPTAETLDVLKARYRSLIAEFIKPEIHAVLAKAHELMRSTGMNRDFMQEIVTSTISEGISDFAAKDFDAQA